MCGFTSLIDTRGLHSVAQQAIKDMIACGIYVKGARVADLVTGGLADAGSVEALSGGLLDMAHGLVSAKRMGNGGRSRALERVSRARMVRSHEAAYQQAVS